VRPVPFDWHDVSDPADEAWPVRYLGADRGVEWVLWVSPAPENAGGNPAPDQIWWETDAITAAEFLLVAGYARFESIDWTGQPGVRCPGEIEQALEEMMSDLDTLVPAAPGGDVAVLQAVDARAAEERPWLTIGDFLAVARDIRLDRPEVRDVQVKARDASLSRLFDDGAVIGALCACAARVRTPGSSLRIWVGAPNLRISLSTAVGNGADWTEVLGEVVALGAGIAAGFGGMPASGNGEPALVN
jgi:hypothetical protein